MIIKPTAYPAFLRPHREVIKGVFVGVCRWRYELTEGEFRSERSLRMMKFPHAHNDVKRLAGWICIPSRAALKDRELMLHEVAHLYQPRQGHKQRWRETLVSIGGSLDHRPTGRGYSYQYPGYHKETRDKYHHPECPCRRRPAARSDLYSDKLARVR